MAKPKVTVKLDSIKNLKNLDSRSLVEIGEMVKKEILSDISRGISSVRGEPSKFASYAIDRPEAKSVYPNLKQRTKYGKGKKPVNLTLKGGYLDKIDYNTTKNSVQIIMKDFTGKIKDLFEAHNLGLNTKMGVPKRKHLPSVKGDRFTVRIEQKILELFRKAADNAIKKGNK